MFLQFIFGFSFEAENTCQSDEFEDKNFGMEKLTGLSFIRNVVK
jgi:hypothetical protein